MFKWICLNIPQPQIVVRYNRCLMHSRIDDVSPTNILGVYVSTFFTAEVVKVFSDQGSQVSRREFLKVTEPLWGSCGIRKRKKRGNDRGWWTAGRQYEDKHLSLLCTLCTLCAEVMWLSLWYDVFVHSLKNVGLVEEVVVDIHGIF